MITKKPTKLLFAAVTIALVFCLPIFADILTDQTLQNDIAYYRKTSGQKNLNANDRAYILNRIKDKYDGSGLDTAVIDQELKQTGRPLPAAKSPSKTKRSAAVKAAPKTTGAGAGRVEKIFVSETTTESKILISAPGASRSNYFLMKDPTSNEPAKIVVDFYGVTDVLSQAAGNISPKQGLFSNVSTEQLEGPPNNVVRVTAQLRQDAPYKVKKEGDVYSVSVEKSPADAAQQAAAVQTPAQAVPAAVATAAPAASPPQQGSIPAAPQAVQALETQEVASPDDAKAASKPVSDGYLIDDGDILGVSIYPAEELSREVVVQLDGTIPFPLIGSAKARGLTTKQLEVGLSQNLGRYISTPQVTVTPKQFSRKQIFITGEVKGVGAYNFKENLRLMEFISSIGGFTDSANRKEVKIYRGPPTKRQIHTVDLEDIIKSGDFSRDFLLEPGDIIEVSKGAAKVAILGDIRSAGYVDYKENMHLVELVSQAGGFNDSAKITEISIIHQSADNKPTGVTKVDLNKILSGKKKDVIIQSGDTVFIPKGGLASANYFLGTIMPWLSLFTLLLVLKI